MGMNRKMRRQALKKNEVVETAAAVAVNAQRQRDEGIKKACEMAGEYYTTLMSLALHDEYGFGQGRIQKVREKMDTISASILSDNIKYDELRDFVANGFKEVVTDAKD